MESLKVINFGPIKNADFELKTIVVLIGAQSSGKSAIAKLITILRDIGFIYGKFSFKEMIEKYELESYLSDKTVIEYTSAKYKFNFNNFEGTISSIDKPLSYYVKKYDEVGGDHIEVEQQFQETLTLAQKLNEELSSLVKTYEGSEIPEDIQNEIQNKITETKSVVQKLQELGSVREVKYSKMNDIFSYSKYSVYIPSERNIYSLLSNTSFSLAKNNIPLPKSILNFGSLLEEARVKVRNLDISFLGLEYIDLEHSQILRDTRTGIELPLSKMSSGVQSLIPLKLIIAAERNPLSKKTFVVEEPEMNLFPEAQYHLIQDIIAGVYSIDETKNDIVFTTHSPYCLSALNNLVTAYQAMEYGESAAEEVKDIIPSETWIKPDHFAAYHLNNGECSNIIDPDTGLIDKNALDNVSCYINDDFNKLFRIIEKSVL